MVNFMSETNQRAYNSYEIRNLIKSVQNLNSSRLKQYYTFIAIKC